jgi:hypothetical protein
MTDIPKLPDTRRSSDLHIQLQRYEALPPSAVISPKATAAILGISERNVRYHPHLPKVQISAGRYGIRKSDIEKLSRDGIPGQEVAR